MGVVGGGGQGVVGVRGWLVSWAGGARGVGGGDPGRGWGGSLGVVGLGVGVIGLGFLVPFDRPVAKTLTASFNHLILCLLS